MHESFLILYHASFAIYGAGTKAWIRRLIFLGICLVHWRDTSLLLNRAAPVSLSNTLRDRPESLGVLIWPYINNTWSVSERVAVILSHHRLAEDLQSINVAINDSIVILNLTDTYFGMTIVLDRPKWFMREGELSLNIFVDGERVYSLAFSLVQQSVNRIAYIGGIQGRNIPAIQETYHSLTKAIFGCRPRDFLIQIFFGFCRNIGVEKIYAVSEACRHHRHKFFSKNHKSLNSSNYDEIWMERGGNCNSLGFFELDPREERRPLADVPAKKRSMYKKRYELFDQLELDIGKLLKRECVVLPI